MNPLSAQEAFARLADCCPGCWWAWKKLYAITQALVLHRGTTLPGVFSPNFPALPSNELPILDRWSYEFQCCLCGFIISMDVER